MLVRWLYITAEMVLAAGWEASKFGLVDYRATPPTSAAPRVTPRLQSRSPIFSRVLMQLLA